MSNSFSSVCIVIVRISTPDLTKLFVLGGYDAFNERHADAEIIDLASSNSSFGGGDDACSEPMILPYDIEEAVGFNVNGEAMVCGG